MTYKVFLVDDEPGAIRFLGHMISTRCPGWEVAGTAENGRMAMCRIKECMPDMVLTDIRMPVMDGIELARQIKAGWPGIRTVLVSGHEDFAAAQNAIKHGVADYILKPVNPVQLVGVMEEAHKYFENHNQNKAAAILLASIAGERVETRQINSCFPEDCFSAAMVRKGALPSRYSKRMSSSLPPVKTAGAGVGDYWVVSGRDEWERFIFQAGKAGTRDYLTEQAQAVAGRLPGHAYTIVLYPQEFGLSGANDVTDTLIRAMDRSHTLGAIKIITDIKNKGPEITVSVDSFMERRILEMCTGLLRTRELRELLLELFDSWQENSQPLYYVYRDLERILGTIERGVFSRKNRHIDYDQQLEEATLLSNNMTELCDRIWNLVLAILNRAENQDIRPGSDTFFISVRDYINQNLAQPISLQTLCAAMGISQTYLSRIFRRHTGLSFSEYLTEQRIAKAKTLMREQPGLPLKMVAELVGYKDPNYFSKVFRSIEGMPPSQFAQEDK